MSEGERLSIEQQADFVDHLITRCLMRGGEVASEATLVLTPDDVNHLHGLAARLRRIAPHEDRIRRMVTGK